MQDATASQTLAGRVRRRLQGLFTPYLAMVVAIVFMSTAYIAYAGFGFVPGWVPQSEFCASDIGQRLDRHGHSEELLWRGCLLASETGTYLDRFAPKRDLRKARADRQGVPACLSCHDGRAAADFGQMWTQFPRWNPQTGRTEDFTQAIQNEIERRYGGIRPNRSDNAVTALHFYAAAKAAQAGLGFRLETAGDAAPAPSEVERLAPSLDCRRKFDDKGWPRGPNAGAIIQGCNLVTQTQEHLRGFIARRWRTDVACKSCHLDAGDKPHAASLAHAAVVLPHMYTAVNQPIRFDRRVLLCFSNSQNGFDLGVDAAEVTYIHMYANWLAQKEALPIGKLPPGRGIPLLYDAQGLGASFLAGERVYRTYCQACHGVNGLGGAGPVFDGAVPPPIAGPHSFSAAASLTDPYRFAGFVYANMPYGADMGHPILTVQQSLDVAAYLTSLGRPSDFTKVNQLRVFINHLWLKIVVNTGRWMSGLAAPAAPGDKP